MAPVLNTIRLNFAILLLTLTVDVCEASARYREVTNGSVNRWGRARQSPLPCISFMSHNVDFAALRSQTS
jgi:hypothetical protein